MALVIAECIFLAKSPPQPAPPFQCDFEAFTTEAPDWAESGAECFGGIEGRSPFDQFGEILPEAFDPTLDLCIDIWDDRLKWICVSDDSLGCIQWSDRYPAPDLTLPWRDEETGGLLITKRLRQTLTHRQSDN